MAEGNFRETIQAPRDRVIVALDNMTWEKAANVMEEAGPHVGMAKANSLAQRFGWLDAVETIEGSMGVKTMADTKFHDIPETVRLQVKEVTSCGASLITVHASAGQEALRRAVIGRDQGMEETKKEYITGERPDVAGLLGITVLTSLDEKDCVSIYGAEQKEKVLQFAKMAQEVGLDGIVCSGEELEVVRADSNLDSLLTVVPGITPTWAKKADDQKRIITPGDAIRSGADMIVVGRAITKPPEGISRQEAAARIEQELTEAGA